MGTTQHALLAAILNRLRAELTLNEANCYEALDPLDPPLIPSGGDYFLTVGFGDSVFPNEFQIGGGNDQCVEYASLVIGIYSRIKTDSTDHAQYLLTDPSRGVYAIKHKILRAMVDYPFSIELHGMCLRQTFYIRSSGQPMVLSSPRIPIGLACLPLEFGCDYDWALEAPLETSSSAIQNSSSTLSSPSSKSSKSSASTPSTPSSLSTTSASSSSTLLSSSSTVESETSSSSVSISDGCPGQVRWIYVDDWYPSLETVCPDGCHADKPATPGEYNEVRYTDCHP